MIVGSFQKLQRALKRKLKTSLKIYDFLLVTSSPQRISMSFSAFCHETLQLFVFFCVHIQWLQRGGQVFKVSLAALGELPQAVYGDRGQ